MTLLLLCLLGSYARIRAPSLPRSLRLVARQDRTGPLSSLHHTPRERERPVQAKISLALEVAVAALCGFTALTAQ